MEHQLLYQERQPRDFPYYWVPVSLACIYIFAKLAPFGAREKYLLPGPPTWPIVGNVDLAVDKDLYKRYEALSVEQHIVAERSKIQRLVRAIRLRLLPQDRQRHNHCAEQQTRSIRTDRQAGRNLLVKTAR